MKPARAIDRLLKSFVHNHAKACACCFCRALRAWPDRERVLAVTGPLREGHEGDCLCVLCDVERLLERTAEVWEVQTPRRAGEGTGP